MKKTNEMPKKQTANHATVPKLMRKGPKYPFAFYVALVLSMTVGAVPVLAAGDPLSVINNLSTFIFSLIQMCIRDRCRASSKDCGALQ